MLKNRKGGSRTCEASVTGLHWSCQSAFMKVSRTSRGGVSKLPSMRLTSENVFLLRIAPVATGGHN